MVPYTDATALRLQQQVSASFVQTAPDGSEIYTSTLADRIREIETKAEADKASATQYRPNRAARRAAAKQFRRSKLSFHPKLGVYRQAEAA